MNYHPNGGWNDVSGHPVWNFFGIVELELLPVTVNNLSPTAAIGPPPSSPEGAPTHLSGSATDPGTDTFTYAWTVTKDGSPYAGGSGATISFTPDDNGIYVVTLTVTDDDGGQDTDTRTVLVTDVAPTVALGGQASVAEGSPYTLTLGAVTDPGADAVTGYRVHWGDGSSDAFTGDPKGQTAVHTYADGPDGYTITVDLTDEDGTHTAAGSLDVAVLNVAPVVRDFTRAGTEDAALPFTADDFTAHFSDPGDDSLAGVRVVTLPAGGTLTLHGTPLTAGQEVPAADLDGLLFTPNADFNGATSFSWSGFDGDDHADDDATVTLTLAAVDDAPAFDPVADQAVKEDAGTQTLLLTNVAAGPADESGQTIRFTVTSSDPGLVPDPVVTAGDGSYTLSFTPAANAAGSVTITLTATDSGANTFQRTFTITVDPVADTPALAVADASGNEGAALPLSIAAGLADPDGSESLSIRIDGMPAGGTLSAGTRHADGYWMLTPKQLAGLTLTTPDDGTLTLTVTVTATEGSNGEAAVAVAQMAITVQNTPPTLRLRGPRSFDPRTPYVLRLSAVDPGDDTIRCWTIRWGDGTTQKVKGNPARVRHQYAPHSQRYTITARATDEDGTFRAARRVVTAQLPDEGSGSVLGLPGQAVGVALGSPVPGFSWATALPPADLVRILLSLPGGRAR